MCMPCWSLEMTFRNSVLLLEEIAVLTLVATDLSLGLILTIMNPHVLSVVSYMSFRTARAQLTLRITDNPIPLRRLGEGSRYQEALVALRC